MRVQDATTQLHIGDRVKVIDPTGIVNAEVVRIVDLSYVIVRLYGILTESRWACNILV